jgi:hypothetical protein
MKVQQLVPAIGETGLERLLDHLSSPCDLAPFGGPMVEFCAGLSRSLFKDAEAQRHPELQSLAFWLRKSAIVRLQQDFNRLATRDTVLVPRGLVFHVPPSNVDTIFVYSWALSAFVGNRNLIRISPRVSTQSSILFRIFNAALDTAPTELRGNTAMIRYGHEREITEAISRKSDVRVIWGGDRSVEAIRSVPLPPHAKELTFPDRHSLSAINAAPYLSFDAAARRALAHGFYNDLFWFDQMGCSSPRLLVWCGDAEPRLHAQSVFWETMADYLQEHPYFPQPATAIQKFTSACRAILDQDITSYRTCARSVSVLELDGLDNFARTSQGGGMIFQVGVARLRDIVPVMVRRDQTLSCSGFAVDELRELVRLLNGRGIDRIVPVGSALSFHRFWDGYDLLQEMCRRVFVDSSIGSAP